MKKIILMVLGILLVSSLAWGDDVMSNGDFESWTAGAPDDWTLIDSGINVSEENSIVRNGLSSANIEVTTGSQANTDFRQTVTVTNGTEYSVSLWVYHTEGTQKARLYVDGYHNYSDNDITGSWQELTYNYTATADEDIEVGLRFYDQSGFDGSEIVYIDDFTMTFTPVAGNQPPKVDSIIQNPSSGITSSTTVSVSADVTDTDGTIEGVELHWGTTSGNLNTTITMSNSSGDTYTTDTSIPAQADGTTVYYEIYAIDDDVDETTSSEQNYTVTDPVTTTLDYAENFTNDLGDCYTYSVSGDSKEWEWDTSEFAKVNGYNSGDLEEDWLILPGIDFDSYSDEVMTFDTWYKYGNDDNDNYLKLLYSTDYPGTGTPVGSTWNELSYNVSASAETWESSGRVELSAISGSNVYIAFKYHYNSGNYKWWEIDNILIEKDNPLPVTLTSFTAIQIQNDQVQLNWQVESESDMMGYNLYRSFADSDEKVKISDLIAAENLPYAHEYDYIDHEAEAGNTYDYYLESIAYDGSSNLFDPVRFVFNAIEDEEEETPEYLEELGNYPNPFNPSTTIKFSVDGALSKYVNISIYNSKGQKIKDLVDEKLAKGNHFVVWNGDDNNGEKVNSGIYFYRLQIEDYYSEMKKMVLVK